MSLVVKALVVLGCCAIVAHGFLNQLPSWRLASSIAASTWQEDLDQILDVDTSCEARRLKSQEIVNKLNEIREDVSAALKERSVERIAPKSSNYGKALIGIRSFQNQLVSDILPELLTKGVPKLVDEGPKIINGLIERGPSQILENGRKAISTAQEIAQDPSMLQSTVDEVRKELKNVIKSTPEGLQTPEYEVLRSYDDFEIRKYAAYSLCSAKMTPSSSDSPSLGSTSLEPFAGSQSFNTLAGYIFGANALDGASVKMSMTTPVFMANDTMSFVLPKPYTAESAPIPDSEAIQLVDIPQRTVAVRTFSGIVTDGEMSRQRAKLEEALIGAGLEYDAGSFQVLQYNPPYTLPWVRRNEILCVVLSSVSPVTEAEVTERSMTEDTSKFFSAPEAGD